MTRRDWWLGIAAIVVVVLLHAALPRYTFERVPNTLTLYVRFDRWTGRAAFQTYDDLRPPK